MNDPSRRHLQWWLNRALSSAASFLLAMLLALVVWAIAVQQENPLQQAEVAGSIRVMPVNIPPGVVLLGDFNEEVQVLVRAPQRTWQLLRPDSFSAHVDLSGLGPGTFDIPVTVTHPDPQVQILEVTPSHVRVRLEEVRSKTLPVRVEVMDTAPFGYEWNTPVVTPTMVTITGAAPYVARVDSAVAEIYLRGAKQTLTREQSVSLRDISGNPTGFVEVVPRTVTVTIPIVQRAGFRDVPVRVRWEGQPAPGYRISNISVEPSIVTVFGVPDAIASLPGYVETTPVSIKGAQADVVERVPLLLPESVSAFGVQAVQVRISITPIEGGLTLERAPVIQGLTPGLTAEVSPLTFDVIIAGPLPRLDVLRAEDVRVVIDLSGLKPGVHALTPTVILPEGIRLESLVPSTAEVQIIAPETTPTPGG
jgi:YbbR domain-containing protein